MPPNVSELIPSWLLLTRGWKTGKRKPIEYNTIQYKKHSSARTPHTIENQNKKYYQSAGKGETIK